MGIFSTNSSFYQFMVRLWDVVKLNFLWLICSLPIVTIGPATIALYTVTLKMVDDQEGHVVTQFIKAFKGNLKQGIPLGLIYLITSYLCYLNFELFNKIEGNPMVFLIAAFVILAVGLVHLTYAFPLAARYHSSLKDILMNASAITFKYAIRTLALWLTVFVLIVLFMFNTTLMFIGFLIGPVAICLTISGFSMWIFKDIQLNH